MALNTIKYDKLFLYNSRNLPLKVSMNLMAILLYIKKGTTFQLPLLSVLGHRSVNQQPCRASCRH